MTEQWKLDVVEKLDVIIRMLAHVKPDKIEDGEL